MNRESVEAHFESVSPFLNIFWLDKTLIDLDRIPISKFINVWSWQVAIFFDGRRIQRVPLWQWRKMSFWKFKGGDGVMVLKESLCIQKKRVTKVGILWASDFTSVIFIKVHSAAMERDLKKIRSHVDRYGVLFKNPW